MNEFITDNFKEGDVLVIRCHQSVVKGKLLSVDADALKIVDSEGYVVTLRGELYSYFHEESRNMIKSNPSTINNDILDNGDERNSDTNIDSSNNTDTPCIINEKSDDSPSIKPQIEKPVFVKQTPYIKNLLSKNLKARDGFLPPDGRLKKYDLEKSFCYIQDFKHPNAQKDVYLKIDEHLLQDNYEDIERLRGVNYDKMHPCFLRYYRTNQPDDKKNAQARIACFDLRVDKMIDIINEREDAEDNLYYFKLYIKAKITDLILEGKLEDAISILSWCRRAETIEPDYSAELLKMQVDIQRKTGNNSALESMLKELKNTFSIGKEKEYFEVVMELFRVQLGNKRNREELLRTLNEAQKINPLSNEVREQISFVKKMPREEKFDFNDLYIDEFDELIEIPSSLISMDPQIKEHLGIDAFTGTLDEEQRRKISEFALARANDKYTDFKDNIGVVGASALKPMRDSAASYFMEALRIARLEDQDILDAVTKFLKLVIGVEMVTLDKKPLFDGNLKGFIEPVIKEGDDRLREILLQAILSVGACSRFAWNKLVLIDEGLKIIYKEYFAKNVKEQTFGIINRLNYCSIPTSQSPADFLQSFFTFKNQKKEQLCDLVSCANLNLDEPDNSTAEWFDQIEELRYLLTSTDELWLNGLSNIVDDLRRVQDVRDDDELLDILNNSRSSIDKLLSELKNNPTFFGRTIFTPICQNWRKVIEQGRQTRVKSQYPEVEVLADPPHILLSSGKHILKLSIRNIGSGKTITPDSFSMRISFTPESEPDKFQIMTCEYDHPLVPDPDRKRNPLAITIQIPDELANYQVLGLQIDTKCRKNSTQLPEQSSYKCTLTAEPRQEDLIGKDDSPVWRFSSEVSDNLFKGRDRLIEKLIKHYTSESESTRSYVLYGLTRMGKSSILSTLAEKIYGKKITIKGQEMVIMPIRCSFNLLTGYDRMSKVWDMLLNQVIYNRLMEYSRKKNPETGEPWNFNIHPVTELKMTARHVNALFEMIHEAGIHPLILFDEYTFVEQIFDEKGMQAGPGFLHDLRELAFNHLASFIYAGTYDTKSLISDPKYGGGQGSMAGQIEYHVSHIDSLSAEQLMCIMSDKLRFTKEAIAYIHRLSGDVPYFIQMICYYCGCFARDEERVIIGYPELEHVIDVMTGRKKEEKSGSVIRIYEVDFLGNMIDKSHPEEHALTSCLVKLGCDSQNNPISVRLDDIQKMWEKNYPNYTLQVLDQSLLSLRDKRVVDEDRDRRDNKLMYKIRIDLFRQWWAAEFSMEIERLDI